MSGHRPERHGSLPSSTITEVPVSDVLIDTTYQRPISADAVAKMRNNWKPSLFGVPVVSRRANGRLYVVDGQHRIAALNAMDTWPERIRVEVFEGLTIAEEAELFWKLDTRRRSLSPFDAFRARLAAGDTEARTLDRAVRDAGATLSRSQGPKHVRCVTALTRILRHNGAERVTEVLRICAAAWPFDPTMAPEAVVTGIDGLLTYANGTADVAHLTTRLASTTPALISARSVALNARSHGSTDSAISAVASIYNQGLRSRKIVY